MKPSPTPPASTSLVADSTTDSAAATSSASAVASAATPATSAGVAATAVPTANSDGKAQRSANAPSGKDTASAASPQDSTPTVHITGSSAAMPEAELPAKSLQEPTDKPQSTASGELPGITARSSSQRATSFVGTADYVSPEVGADQACCF